jgi:hypothetical protein
LASPSSLILSEGEGVVCRKVFGFEEVEDETTTLNRWNISALAFQGYVDETCFVYYHSHVSAMFPNVPDIYRLCFDINRRSVFMNSRLEGASHGAYVTCDQEVSSWINSFLLWSIYLWSLFVRPDDPILFGDAMFVALASGQAARNGHLLTRMSGFSDFQTLCASKRMRSTTYASQSIRMRSKKFKERVLNPSLFNARPEGVKSLTRTDSFLKAKTSMGPPNIIDSFERASNVGVGFDSASIELRRTGECVDIDDVEDMQEFCRTFAGCQETTNLLMSGLEKIAKRAYRSHQLISSNANGTFLRDALGGMSTNL